MTMGNEVWMDGAPGTRIWMDGTIVDWGEARVHILTHTLHYGLGLFEGIRCYKTPRGPAIFRLPEHVSRLFEGAQIIGMQLPFTEEQITSAIKQTVTKTPWRSATSGPWSTSAMASWGLIRWGSRFASPSRPGPGGHIWAKRAWPRGFGCGSLRSRATIPTS
jgi:branched-subunit amino acid aminotransferase/4-amino-4-deoxychorismate lyase